MTPKTKRVTITVRADLLSEIRRQAPNLSQFFSDAASEYLKRTRFRVALRESAGAWKVADHPELTGPESVAAYVEGLRREWFREG